MLRLLDSRSESEGPALRPVTSFPAAALIAAGPSGSPAVSCSDPALSLAKPSWFRCLRRSPCVRAVNSGSSLAIPERRSVGLRRSYFRFRCKGWRCFCFLWRSLPVGLRSALPWATAQGGALAAEGSSAAPIGGVRGKRRSPAGATVFPPYWTDFSVLFFVFSVFPLSVVLPAKLATITGTVGEGGRETSISLYRPLWAVSSVASPPVATRVAPPPGGASLRASPFVPHQKEKPPFGGFSGAVFVCRCLLRGCGILGRKALLRQSRCRYGCSVARLCW